MLSWQQFLSRKCAKHAASKIEISLYPVEIFPPNFQWSFIEQWSMLCSRMKVMVITFTEMWTSENWHFSNDHHSLPIAGMIVFLLHSTHQCPMTLSWKFHWNILNRKENVAFKMISVTRNRILRKRTLKLSKQFHTTKVACTVCWSLFFMSFSLCPFLLLLSLYLATFDKSFAFYNLHWSIFLAACCCMFS